MRGLRDCMRNLEKYPPPSDDLLTSLSQALVQTYQCGTDKKARYRPKSLHKKPLGDPQVRKMNPKERKILAEFQQNHAA